MLPSPRCHLAAWQSVDATPAGAAGARAGRAPSERACPLRAYIAHDKNGRLKPEPAL
jgi:hypothetical protein